MILDNSSALKGKLLWLKQFKGGKRERKAFRLSSSASMFVERMVAMFTQPQGPPINVGTATTPIVVLVDICFTYHVL
jgi:hypothetical protein